MAVMDHQFWGRYRGRRVLVTGHTGFKGSWLVIWLLSLGAEVCGYSKDIPTQPSMFEEASLQNRIRHEVGDVRDYERFADVYRSFKPDFVFHLAAQAIVSTSYAEPVETIATNVVGTAVVLDAIRRVGIPCTAVIITSDKAYNNVEWHWGYRENDALGGGDIYSGSKGAAELIFRSYWQSFFSKSDEQRLVTSRAGNVIGGGDWAKDRIVADCIRAWLKHDKVTIRSPNATRPWQHVLEPLSGYLCLGAKLAEDASLDGESFNFGPRSEQNATVLQLLSSLAEIWGFSDPNEAYKAVDEIPFHEAGLLKLNIDKAWGYLRWQPTLTYEECVDVTATWYRNVLVDHADAFSVTQKQIERYSDLAASRQQCWSTHEPA